MNGCIRTNLEVVSTDSPQLRVYRPYYIAACAYARDRKMKMARASENRLESAVRRFSR